MGLVCSDKTSVDNNKRARFRSANGATNTQNKTSYCTTAALFTFMRSSDKAARLERREATHSCANWTKKRCANKSPLNHTCNFRRKAPPTRRERVNPEKKKKKETQPLYQWDAVKPPHYPAGVSAETLPELWTPGMFR